VNWSQTGLNNNSVISLSVNGNNIYAGTLTGVYKSSDNGTNWSQIGLSNLNIMSIFAFDNIILAGTISYGIYYSLNDGNTWIQSNLYNTGVNAFQKSGNKIYAATNYGIYYSTNNGITWIRLSLEKAVMSINIIGNNIIAGTEMEPSDSAGVYISTNLGINWTRINQGFNVIPSVYGMFIVDNYILAGTFRNSVWRRSLSEIIGIQNISSNIPDKFSLYQNYPNPFNPVTKIKFDVASGFPLGARGNDRIVLKVYDILGKEIQTLVNEKLNPGTYEVTFDGSKCASGVYFYRLTTDNFSEIKKMILLK